ncbi:hypothetical protein MTBBW1_2360029 [Desulfamplus magnetovallimortis]|uniref:Uncharacterized protein n=1 Tax=Desulfamplus magnetovallimortis TaxID=1246637 RepID=A0A1W1HDY3_9BACT|nr:hypothetical protein MTBBW1_2360029 [Desulfamplus magnetovallimortis]
MIFINNSFFLSFKNKNYKQPFQLYNYFLSRFEPGAIFLLDKLF